MQIYVLFLYTYGKTSESGEKGPSLMRHIYKRFFSKIEELRNYLKKKSGHRNNEWGPQFVTLVLGRGGI
jgi:hypothetical protein